MSDGDFRSTEQSVTVADDAEVRIEQVAADGEVTVLKDGIPVLAGEVLDASVMRRAALREFLAEQIADAKEQGVLFSVHLKATMMRVSDPIIFGHAVRAFFADVFAEHGDALKRSASTRTTAWRRCSSAIETLPEDERDAVKTAIDAAYENGPALAMVDSTGASPTSTCLATSSSTRRCRRRSAPRARCGTPTASCRTPSS